MKSKKPLLIEGRAVYDLMGNDYTGTLDAYQRTPLGGENPVQLSGSYRVFRGGSWYDNAGNLRSANRNNVYADGRRGSIGLRLVRTLP